MLSLVTPAITPNLDPEATEQVRLIQWAMRNRDTLPPLGFLFHVPNGGHRSKREGALLKLQGVRRGVPDLFLPYPVQPHHGLWVEMKPELGGTVSPEQRQWLADLSALGYRAHVCHGFEEARQTILNYLGVTQ